MPVKLSTTLNNISLLVNPTNIDLIREFYEYLKNNSASEKHIKPYSVTPLYFKSLRKFAMAMKWIYPIHAFSKLGS
jgi:hypothetical protein